MEKVKGFTFEKIKKQMIAMGIKTYKASLSEKILDNVINISEEKDYLEILKDNQIRQVFLELRYPSFAHYQITYTTYDVLNAKQEEMTCIEKQVSDYNTAVLRAGFLDTPEEIISFFVMSGYVFCYRYINEIKLDKGIMEYPTDKLKSIIKANETKIEEERASKRRFNEDYINFAKEYVLSDPKFLTCKNQRLRRDYVVEFAYSDNIPNELGDLWTNKKGGVYLSAVNFIEDVWIELKNKKI